MSFPALIPEAVIIAGISVIDMKPVTITVVAVSDLNKLCEISADVIENAVKYYLDAVFVQLFAKCGKICVCAESAVYFCIS